MEIRNSPNKFGQTTFSSVLYGKILVNYIIPFRIKSNLKPFDQVKKVFSLGIS